MEELSKTENIMEQEQNIRWDSTNPTQLDLRYYSHIGNLAKMTLWGGIVFAILGIISLIFSIFNQGGITSWDFISIIFERGILLYLCIRAYNSLIYRKENAIFLTRFILCMCLFSFFLNAGICLYFNQISSVFNKFSGWILIWCISGLVYMASDEEFQQVFPKSFRNHSGVDVLLVLSYFMLPFTCSFISGFITAIDKESAAYDTKIQNMNLECPFVTDWGGIVTSVEQDESTIVFNCDISDSFNMKTMQKYKAPISTSLIQYFQTLSPYNFINIRNLSKWENDVILRIRKETGEKIDITISKDDLASAVGKKPTSYGKLKTQVEIANISLPAEVEDGVILIKVSLSKDLITYHYEVDEDLIDIEFLQENEEELKNSHKEEIVQDRNRIAICKENHIGVSFQYIGSKSKQKIEIKFTEEEMKQL